MKANNKLYYIILSLAPVLIWCGLHYKEVCLHLFTFVVYLYLLIKSYNIYKKLCLFLIEWIPFILFCIWITGISFTIYFYLYPSTVINIAFNMFSYCAPITYNRFLLLFNRIQKLLIALTD